MSLTKLRSFGIAELRGLPVSGRRRFGVPIGGAFDQESFALANALGGLSSEVPAWELGMAQASFRAESAGTFAVVGAPCTVRIGDRRLSGNAAYSVEAGEEFTVEPPSEGARVYVAFGVARSGSAREIHLEDPPSSFASRHRLRVVAGPHAECFAPDALKARFSVARNSDRVGVRLEPPIHAHQIELASEPQCFGTIQVSNDGSPIIIGPDGPTIGGYPKLAVVISGDLSRVGQLRPGDHLEFEMVSIAEARVIGREAAATQARRLALIRLANSTKSG